MVNEDTVQIALGLKFRCLKCKKVYFPHGADQFLGCDKNICVRCCDTLSCDVCNGKYVHKLSES